MHGWIAKIDNPIYNLGFVRGERCEIKKQREKKHALLNGLETHFLINLKNMPCFFWNLPPNV